MKCQRCGEKPAGIHYTEVRGGKKVKLVICEDCATELGFAPVGPAPDSVKAAPEADETEAAVDPLENRRCPACGLAGGQLRRESRFGCPECYEAFAAALSPLLRRLHGSATHRGRLPGGRTATPIDEGDLRRRLEVALGAEDYEEAARLRDLLGRPPDDSGPPPSGPRTGNAA